MLDINLLRNDPEKVKENIRKKFQDQKLPMVDEVIAFDREYREAIQQADGLRNKRKTLSKQIGGLLGKGLKEEAEKVKAEVAAMADELEALEKKEEELKGEIRKRMLVIPNIIDDSVPIGKDDSENVEIQRYGEPVVPEWEIRVLLPDGRHCPAAQRHPELCAGFHDRPGLHLCGAAFHDPRQRGDRRHELRRDGEHDVQDRG